METSLELVADRLSIVRGNRRVLEGVSLTVARGEVLLLTGANGAGKTTLLRCLAGLIPPAAGTIRLTGADTDATVGEQCHFVGHRDALKGVFTASENLAAWQTCLDGTAGPDVAGGREQALERLGLAELSQAPAAYLSAGQRRRLALARLLVVRRPLWLLDEPTVSLDAASVEIFAALLRGHLESGGIAVAATHLPLHVDGARELRLGPGAKGLAA